MSAASLAAAAEGDHVALLASGAWTVERAAELERLIEDASRRHAGARSIDIDLAGLERLDTFGAWLIERLKRSFLRRGSAARITGLSETDRALMAELRAVNQVAFKKRAAPNAILVALNAVGRNVAEIGGSLVLVVQLLGALVLAVLGTIAHPRRLALHFDRASSGKGRLARGADHRALDFHDRRHSGATGHFPFPHLRRRYVCRRHGRRCWCCARSAC